MPLFKIIILAIIQGLAELLPVSSSAHVVVAERIMGLNASSPQMTLMLVMLHTGTMFAVIVYFWNQWRRTYFRSQGAFNLIAIRLIWATFLTGIVGLAAMKIAEKTLLKGVPHAQIEDLFNHLGLIAPALLAVGILILVAGLLPSRESDDREPSMAQSAWIGIVQGLCIPFRGFSRSGATISTGMLTGVTRERSETFSFALVILLTPLAVGKEVLRLVHAKHITTGFSLASAMVPGLTGMFFAFLAGLVALKWLSRWLEGGRWYFFGIYCIVASGVVFYLHHIGY
ncbi:MAG TPA: undecaprenyl-diphosphate phosphatase [Acidobacteriaceae bacterium]|nr:undecaprenyl-diphosphate phosphatase [Acidobacteriaceae bacterium]